MSKQILTKDEQNSSVNLDLVSKLTTEHDPETILRDANKELQSSDGDRFSAEGNVFKALTLQEFHNGGLMTTAMPDQYKTFAINMLREIQKEYSCERTDEKATAELATISYVRTLEIQRRMNNYLNLPSVSDLGVKFLAVMSKDLDRAHRQYLSAIYALKTSKQTPFVLNVKTNTAVLGQNQLVQANN